MILLKAGGTVKSSSWNRPLATDEKAFWLATAHPRKTAAEFGERLRKVSKAHFAACGTVETIQRMFAFFLASYARDARVRVEAAKNLPALQAVRSAWKRPWMKFERTEASISSAQRWCKPLFYGVFSGWVLWHKENPQRGRVRLARRGLDTARANELKGFTTSCRSGKLRPLGLVEVLDWTAGALNRLQRNEFFARFVEEHAVQYFYEPFLEAFDPELRKQLGVWYTPAEIVQTRCSCGCRFARGTGNSRRLADPRVFVLDPCCGTGAYLCRGVENHRKRH